MSVELHAVNAVSQAQAIDLETTPVADSHKLAPLKICLLGYRSDPYGGGQGIYLKYLSKALVEAGHTVDVISGQPYPHLDERVKLIKMPGMNLFETGLGSLRPRHMRSMTNIIEWTGKLTGAFSEPYCFGRRVYKYLRRHGSQYDIIHDNQCLSYGVLNLQKRGMPLVTTIHHPISSDLKIALAAASGMVERILIRRWHGFLIMQRQVAQQLHNVVTVSSRSRQDIAAAFDIQPAAINVVHCGIDTEVFRPLPGVVKDPNLLMATVSADQPLKGVRYLLQAFAELLKTRPNLQLLMVGRPREGGDTAQLIEQLNLANNIRSVTGISTEDLVRYYNEASVVVVPSVYEGFGLPAGEAMACGTALVSTDGGALPEVIGDAALQVPTKDAAAIAQAVEQLLSSPEQRAAYEAAGRQRIEDKFSWARAAQEMTQYYGQVIESENG